MDHAASVKNSIFVDEIGIEYGRYGDCVLKTAYQPIFRLSDGGLLPIGVEALAKVFVEGRPLPTSEFFTQVARHDRFLVECLCRRLHLRNYCNIGVPGLRLFFNCDPRGHSDTDTVIEQIRYMASRLDDLELEPAQLVCEITENKALDETMLLRLAAEMRLHGIRLAIDDFGAGHSTPARLDMIEPDIVKLDGSWFRQIARVETAARLLGQLVRSLHDKGIEVLIEGIETPDQLRIAINAGADLLQGFLLARPALAGTVFDTDPLDPLRLSGAGGNVIPLMRGTSKSKTG